MLRANRGRSISQRVQKCRTVMRFAVQAAVETLENRRLLSGYTLTDLGTLGGANSAAYAINDSGQVTGWADTGDPGTSHAFLYSNGSMSDLGSLNGDSTSEGRAINASGQIVGGSYTSPPPVHGFLYSNGSMQDLAQEPLDQPTGINASGVISGQGPWGGGYQPYIYDSVNGLQQIPLLDGYQIGAVGTLNNVGQVPGGSYITFANYWRGTVYDMNTSTLSALPDSVGQSFASAINDDGLATGWMGATR
ncbi:MAG TPA: hypothetical protein VL282_06950, partial [Tepidisphaeraceae bacterium]|nr:hypothetical protein [Tepidisphaeraceae bacterium]